MNIQIISTEKVPQSGSPLSQAVRAGNLVFVSGTVPVDPSTGRTVTGGIGEQTRQVLNNIRVILEEAGAALDSVVKTTVYLIDLSERHEFNDVYREFFSEDFPARSTFEVSALAADYRVEIEAVAGLGE